MRAIASLVLILLSSLLSWPVSAAPASAEVLPPATAEARAAAGELTIIDVRLLEEWAETGLPAGAVGISLQNPETLRRDRTSSPTCCTRYASTATRRSR